MRLDLKAVIDLRFICVQCGRELEIQGVKERNPAPLLKCPDCGVRIQVQQGPGMQLPGSMKSRYPPLKPKRV